MICTLLAVLWYVAVAEALQLPLATLDERLAKTQGLTCDFLTPRG